MKRIAFFDLEPWEAAYLKKHFRGFAVDCFSESLTEKNAGKARNADAVGVFIYSPVTSAVLSKLPKLKLVTTLSTGFDHVDVSACKKRGISVCNVPEYGSNTVAEHAFALLLCISRRIPASLERTKRGDFRLEGLRGFDLAGKTLGLVGFGKIGRHMARIAQGFEMNVFVFDPFLKASDAKTASVKKSSLASLLHQSDVISLHAPLNEKTRHLINLKNVRQIKPGAVLINTSRGGLVQTEALLLALKEKRLAAVGLDVLEEECFIREERELLRPDFRKVCDLQTVLQEHALLSQDNVFVTPHNAFNSQEALERILQTTVDNVKGFFAGKTKNQVNT